MIRVYLAPIWRILDGMDSGEHWRLGRRPALDGLRGVAILLVIASHLTPDGVYGSGGPIGVTVFFVLSGFLITSLLLEERDRTGAVSLRAFYLRRARRLLPALGVVLAFAAGMYAVCGLPLRQLLPVVLYVANWFRATGHTISLLNHTWSLAIEEQFYILWPLVLIVGLRRRRALFWLILIAAAASFGLRILYWNDGAARQDRIWFGTDTNLFGLLAGCALALWMSGRHSPRNKPVAALLAVAALVAEGLATSSFSYTFTAPLTAAAAGAVAIWLLCGSGPVGVFGASWLRYVGRRSYAYYLWHVVLLLLLQMAVSSTPAVVVLTIILTGVLGELSWRFVEAPVLRGFSPAQESGWIVAPSHQPETVQLIG